MLFYQKKDPIRDGAIKKTSIKKEKQLTHLTENHHVWTVFPLKVYSNFKVVRAGCSRFFTIRLQEYGNILKLHYISCSFENFPTTKQQNS